MKHRIKTILIALTLICAMVSAHAADVLMPQFKTKTVIVDASAPVTFYDMKGEADITSSSSNNSVATTIFKPQSDGYVIKIAFEYVDVKNDVSSWPGHLKIYNGVFDTLAVTYPTTTSGVEAKPYFLQHETMLDSLDGTFSNKEYVSTSDDGALSACFQYKYAKKCRGWKATVSAIEKKAMTIVSAQSQYTDLCTSVYAGQKGTTMAGLKIVSDGFSSPDKLRSIRFTVENNGVIDPLALKLYKGMQKRTSTLTDIDCTVTADDDGTYTLTTDYTLSQGDNILCLGTDILTSCAFHSTATVNITSFTTDKYSTGYTPFVQSTATTISVSPTIQMQNGAATHSVTEAFTLYDDGGPEGKISNNFDGTLTLTPSTSGKKVMIDFDTINLFYTSSAVSVGNEDILKIYNGPEATPANLICQIKSATASNIAIKSTSADGTLTIQLKSKTPSAYYQGNGFKASVSEFTPQAMTVESIVADQDTLQKIAAGTTDAPALVFNIRTINTEPALAIETIRLNTLGTYGRIAQASVYYTKSDSTFATTKQIAQADIASDIVDIALNTPLSLSEGDNYFWITYDLTENALSKEKIKAQIDRLGISGTTYTDIKTLKNQGFAVENKALSDCGTQSHKVYDPWIFTHTPGTIYTYKYAPVICDQLTTFVPTTEGHIIEIDFSDFDVAYSNDASYSAKYEIYSGTDISGEKLWEINLNNCDKGPSKVLRSSAADGSLTIRFNPNTEHGSYAQKGWHATVREYLPTDKKIDSVVVTQSSTDIIKCGEKGAPLIGIEYYVSGMLNELTLTDITFNLKNSADIIDSLHLFYTADSATPTYTTPIAKISVADANSVTLSLSEPISLIEGTNYLWLTADIAADAAVNRSIDAAVTSTIIGATEHTPIKGDPDGERTIKNVLYMQSGVNDKVLIGSQPLIFYDCGGADGTTPKGFKGNITFIPTVENSVIELNFIQWKISGNDRCNIYFADTVQSSHDVRYSNTTSTADPLISESPDGSLTFEFNSPSYSTASDGWAIEVKCHTLVDLSIESVKVEPFSSKSTAGSSDIALLAMAIKVVGDQTPINITNFTFNVNSTNATDITKASVFFTDTASVFSSNDTFGTATTVPYSIDGNYTIDRRGTYYFWLACDVASTAAVTNTIKASLASITTSVGNQPSVSAIGSTTITAGIHGNFIIGSSDNAHFADINSAFASLSGGIDGSVVFEIEEGTYTDRIEVPEIKGASATNTITLAAQQGATVRISNNSYSSPGYGEPEYGLMTITGADYLTIKGINFATTNTAYPALIYIRNRSMHVTIDSCTLTAPMETSFSNDINLVYMEAENTSNANNDYFTIINSRIEGGYNGVRLSGTSYVALPKQKGGSVINCKFINQGAKSLYITGERALTISGNTFENDATDKSGFNAIDATAYDDTRIQSNRFILNTQKNCTAIVIRSINKNEGAPAYITNNEISIASNASSASYALEISGSSTNVFVAHNTAMISGSNNSSIVFKVGKTLDKSTVANNIFYNSTQGMAMGIPSQEVAKAITFDHNLVYSASNKVVKISSATVGFDDWKTTDATAINETVSFASNSLLIPTAEGNLTCGTQLPYANTDIVGTTRPAITTIGAYQYDASLWARPAFLTDYPQVTTVTHSSASISIKLDNNGLLFILPYPATDAAPDKATLLANATKIEVNKNRETTIDFTTLTPATQYNIYYIVANLATDTSDVTSASASFTTLEAPIVISDFENSTTDADAIIDGTQRITGFKIIASTALPSSKKAVETTTGGTIILSNTVGGCTVPGMFVRSKAQATATIADGNNHSTSVEIASTDGLWKYLPLSSYGNIKSITIATTDTLMIDNFGAQPYDVELTPLDEKNSVDQGQTITLTATIAESYLGVPPYTYLWLDSKGNTLSSSATLSFAPQSLTVASVTVTDAIGSKANSSTTIIVSGKAAMATFEEIPLEPESHWNGRPEWDGDYYSWYSGSYEFSIFTMPTYNYWSGFACSNETSKQYSTLNHQFRSAVGGAYEGDNYGVYFASGDDKVTVTNNVNGDSISGFYITNSAWAVDAIVNGDGMSSNPSGFAQGDYFSLSVIGLKNDLPTDTATFYLADYRSTVEADHYYIDTWQWLDLRKLGVVNQLKFVFDGTKTNNYGLTTPTYFCLDNLNGKREISSIVNLNIEVGTNTIDLSRYFNLAVDGSTVKYDITDNQSSDIDMTITNSSLSCSALNSHSEASVIISATQKGKTQYVQFEITTSTPTATHATTDYHFDVYPNPAVDIINIHTLTPSTSSVANIYSIDGKSIKRIPCTGTLTTIDVTDLTEGIYIIEVADENTISTQRVIITR